MVKGNEMVQYVACKGIACRIFGRKTRRKDHFEDLGVGGRILIKWILEILDGVVWSGLLCLRIGTSGGLL
jgi:hypothetical protein